MRLPAKESNYANKIFLDRAGRDVTGIDIHVLYRRTDDSRFWTKAVLSHCWSTTSSSRTSKW